jgi:hypothetical protein
MNIISQLFGGGITGIGDAFKSIMGTFKLDPETKAKMEMAIEENKFQLAQMDADLTAKMQDIAGQNIRAESTSGDKFTSRARPSFIYVMLGIIVMNYVVFPIMNRPAIVFPEALFWLFGSCMLGYTGARTWEKIYGGGKQD